MGMGVIIDNVVSPLPTMVRADVSPVVASVEEARVIVAPVCV